MRMYLPRQVVEALNRAAVAARRRSRHATVKRIRRLHVRLLSVCLTVLRSAAQSTSESQAGMRTTAQRQSAEALSASN